MPTAEAIPEPTAKRREFIDCPICDGTGHFRSPAQAPHETDDTCFGCGGNGSYDSYIARLSIGL
jgi:hypothetical protein